MALAGVLHEMDTGFSRELNSELVVLLQRSISHGTLDVRRDVCAALFSALSVMAASLSSTRMWPSRAHCVHVLESIMSAVDARIMRYLTVVSPQRLPKAGAQKLTRRLGERSAAASAASAAGGRLLAGSALVGILAGWPGGCESSYLLYLDPLFDTIGGGAMPGAAAVSCTAAGIAAHHVLRDDLTVLLRAAACLRDVAEKLPAAPLGALGAAAEGGNVAAVVASSMHGTRSLDIDILCSSLIGQLLDPDALGALLGLQQSIQSGHLSARALLPARILVLLPVIDFLVDRVFRLPQSHEQERVRVGMLLELQCALQAIQGQARDAGANHAPSGATPGGTAADGAIPRMRSRLWLLERYFSTAPMLHEPAIEVPASERAPGAGGPGSPAFIAAVAVTSQLPVGSWRPSARSVAAACSLLRVSVVALTSSASPSRAAGSDSIVSATSVEPAACSRQDWDLLVGALRVCCASCPIPPTSGSTSDGAPPVVANPFDEQHLGMALRATKVAEIPLSCFPACITAVADKLTARCTGSFFKSEDEVKAAKAEAVAVTLPTLRVDKPTVTDLRRQALLLLEAAIKLHHGCKSLVYRPRAVPRLLGSPLTLPSTVCWHSSALLPWCSPPPPLFSAFCSSDRQLKRRGITRRACGYRDLEACRGRLCAVGPRIANRGGRAASCAQPVFRACTIMRFFDGFEQSHPDIRAFGCPGGAGRRCRIRVASTPPWAGTLCRHYAPIAVRV